MLRTASSDRIVGFGRRLRLDGRRVPAGTLDSCWLVVESDDDVDDRLLLLEEDAGSC